MELNVLIMWIIIVVIVIIISIPIRRFRDKKYWALWNEIIQKSEESSSLYFGQVKSIRQLARTGTKAYINWIKGFAPEAIWMKGISLKFGDYILVDGSSGDGWHHNETVFYINILYMRLPRDAEDCYNRYRKRLEKEALKTEIKDNNSNTDGLNE